jgi:EAL and modified HD-GYP domain-containing signal transduction protein
VSSRRLSASQVAQMRLLAALLKPSVSLLEVESLLKQEAALSLRVLRSVNSAAMGLRREIHSIREALVLLGLEQLRKWASLWTLAGLNQGPAEVLTMTVVRARVCEALGQAAAREDQSHFLLGLCSLLDALLGQPMPAALADLPLPDATREALLGADNDARRVLTTVVAYERGQWAEAAAGAERLGADPEVLPALYLDALAWARQTSRAGLDAA